MLAGPTRSPTLSTALSADPRGCVAVCIAKKINLATEDSVHLVSCLNGGTHTAELDLLMRRCRNIRQAVNVRNLPVDVVHCQLPDLLRLQEGTSWRTSKCSPCRRNHRDFDLLGMSKGIFRLSSVRARCVSPSTYTPQPRRPPSGRCSSNLTPHSVPQHTGRTSASTARH